MRPSSVAEETIVIERQADNLVQRFEAVAAVLADLDIESPWAAATQKERKVLVDELLEEVALFPDHLEVEVAGIAPAEPCAGRGGGGAQSCVGGGT